MKNYHQFLEGEVNKIYSIAKTARSKMLDPSKEVEILTANELAGRVESLVSVAIPELSGSGLRERILELEEKLGKGNEEIGFIIANEGSQGRFVKFDKRESSIEAGIRIGTAYWTLGVTTAPLEGFTHVKIKNRMDGGDYLAIYLSGPIRSAGGTTTAMIVMLADFLRKKFEIGEYDPTPQEVERYFLEMESYHRRVARLQYMPTGDEARHVVKNLPVEVDGEATEQIEVLAYKDLPRIATNRIRGGMALTMSMIALKAPKLLKRMKTFGKKYGLENWGWLKDLKKLKSEGVSTKTGATYIAEIPGGRPVFSYPDVRGGFRLRYGKARNTGFASVGVHPATMVILDNFIAVGTQLKVELPGKAAAVSPVDSIDGPVVRLRDGTVIKVRTEEQARDVRKDVEKILYVGDILISYGEFLTNGHPLEEPGWCEEWWLEEVLAKDAKFKNLKIDFDKALEISRELGVPLHPEYSYFWESLTGNEVKKLKANLKSLGKVKDILEKLGVEHSLMDGRLVLNEVNKKVLETVLSGSLDEVPESGIDAVNKTSPVRIMRKAGRYVGTRMGRPEKAERRLMTGKPHVLFPVGRMERMRNIVEAFKTNLRAELALRVCPKCNVKTYYLMCNRCGSETEQKKICVRCGVVTPGDEHCGMATKSCSFTRVNENLETISTRIKVTVPPLIKGVRGMSSKTKIPERLDKGLLRAKYDLYVNKDGTIRIDSTDLPLTHFKPMEIDVGVEKLRELGYTEDIKGRPLTREDQILELKPQDILLSDTVSFSSSDYMVKVSKFVDELLERFYGMPPFYNIRTREGLLGQVVIGLAPHTSAGIVGRIIGFAKARSGYAHPTWHAAKKRNCDGDEDSVMLLLDALLNFSREFLPANRGGRTMDVPLVITTVLDLKEVDDEVLDMDMVERYPLEFYRAAMEKKAAWEVSVDTLGSINRLDGLVYTHDTRDISAGPIVTAYRSLGPMLEKVKVQLELAEKIDAVDENNVAEKILSTHFLKDIKGNLRQFSNQGFRCVSCNAKYRRFPIVGKCERCGGKIILTVHEGTVKKYYESSTALAKKYDVSDYIKSQLRLLEKKMDLAFGVKEKQGELEQWLN